MAGPTFTPVDHDPFAAQPSAPPQMVPVDHDPFALLSIPGSEWQRAKEEIDKLPEALRAKARSQWADAAVTTERKDGGVMQRIDDGVRRAAQGVPGIGSWLDETNAAISGQDYHMRHAYEQARDRAVNAKGVTTTLATTPKINVPLLGEVGGDITTGGLEKAAGAVAGAVALPFARLMPGAGVIPTAVNVGANAAGYGALEAAGNAEDGQRIDAAKDAALKSGATGAALGGILGKVVGRAERPVAAPAKSVEELKGAAGDAYAKSDAAGVIFKGDGIKRIGQEITDDLAEHGYHPDLQPRIKTVLKEIDRLSSQDVTLKGVDQLRRIAGSAGKSLDASERMLAGRVIDKIDELVASPRTGEIMTGNSAKASEAITEARDLWSRAKKTELIEAAVDKADRRAASTGSGGNVNNATRQNVRALLDNPKTARNFSDEEKQLMDQVARGTASQNVLRQIGKLSPSGNGLMMSLLLDHLSTGGSLTAAHGIGFIAKKLSDKGTAKNVEALQSLVSNGEAATAMTKWGERVQGFRQGNVSEGTLRVATDSLAKMIASKSGVPESDVRDALAGGMR